ncbi:P-loop containing nucleoside triphosphate hydrolase protein [Cantharellus anzutake]|uniref:P-loop containing nucleoside triphosphate hydrolase protein n=1 Tax=Cantharellus anzutake TaxID=1750568 RepID=UPI00190300D3|nr:P-loop containing nucleoside triphosphate hydrolase protein [Cantharellus anzutake]KAF8338147.1 P-loop containing nucleoside triphosphate hydrolase protein [Cantharellus anzutake]
MSEIAFEIRDAFPPDTIDEVIVQYLGGLWDDPDEDSADVLKVTKELLRSAVRGYDAEINKLISRLTEESNKREELHSKLQRPALTRLDNVIDMSQTGAISKTIGFSEGVDLSSITKGKHKKLEKAEAKLKAKIEKRARRDLYEGSKLLDMQKKQQTYEDMFLKINPLEARTSSKGKSKDIHLQNIDVSFGSHRILQVAREMRFDVIIDMVSLRSGASLTLAYGRRYGLIGRNGIGKSTLLRHIALRELPVPSNISILFVEQEIVGDDTPAIESVLKADVWRDRLMTEERDLNAKLAKLETSDPSDGAAEAAREEAESRLVEVHASLADMEAETGPARAAQLLAGLGFAEEDQHRLTKTFSGGWRMRLALARALFVKPDLLMLDEPSNHIDLNALAWFSTRLLANLAGTILVVSHDRAFLDAVATDIATKTERERNQRKEYHAQMEYRAHLQAFIDRWRYNANRAAQAQSKIKILEKLPELEPPEEDETEKFKFPETDKISPPLLQLSEVTFGYTLDRIILRNVSIDVGLESRIAVVGSNGSGKSTLIKLLTGELKPLSGDQIRNGRLRIAYFAQHHVDTLPSAMSAVSYLAQRFPGRNEQEYRAHLGAFGISGLTGLQSIETLSGGQKSRVAFAVLSLHRPHILLLDEPTNHLDMEGLDALMHALGTWNGGVILISHDERFITRVASELWVCADDTVKKYYGDVEEYKKLIISNIKTRP